MLKIDYKEIVNPLILLPLIILISYLIGFRNLDLLIQPIMIFFGISLGNTIFLFIRKKIRLHHYLFVYVGLLFSLIFVIPLFYLIRIKQPILMGFFMLGLTDFIIQAYYNILPRKNGKQIIKLWKDKLIKSERVLFHPISAQKYRSKDFTTEIIEPDRRNPSQLFSDTSYLPHHLVQLMTTKRKDLSIKHQFDNKDVVVFQLYVDKQKLSKLTNYLHNSYNSEHHTKLAKDTKLLNNLKKINIKIAKNIITSYTWAEKCRIVFRKEFVLENSNEVYFFLKQVVNS
ncbi:hypothetical protein KY331_03580 [Candidatus Woesearchaeota archaeon]|nr:hypothetical protein [Candidatus Woesearchaeota archaeon]